MDETFLEAFFSNDVSSADVSAFSNFKEKNKDLKSWLAALDNELALTPESLDKKLAWVYCNLKLGSLPAAALSSPLDELYSRLIVNSEHRLPGAFVFYKQAEKLFQKNQIKLSLNFYERALNLLNEQDSNELSSGKAFNNEKSKLISSYNLALEKELLSAEKRKESKNYKESLIEKISSLQNISKSVVQPVVQQNNKSSSMNYKSLEDESTASNDSSDKSFAEYHVNEETLKNESDDISFLAGQKNYTLGDEDADLSEFKIPNAAEASPDNSLEADALASKQKVRSSSTSYLPLAFFVLAGVCLAFVLNSFRRGDFSLDFIFNDDNREEVHASTRLSNNESISTSESDSEQVAPLLSEALPIKELPKEEVKVNTESSKDEIYSNLTSKIENIGKEDKNQSNDSESDLSEASRGVDEVNEDSSREVILEPEVISSVSDSELPSNRSENQKFDSANSAPYIENSESATKDNSSSSSSKNTSLETLPKLPQVTSSEVIDSNSSREVAQQNRAQQDRGQRRRRRVTPLSRPNGVTVNKFASPKSYEVIKQTDVYTSPSLRSSALVRLDRGAKIRVIARFGSWLELESNEGNRGFIFSQDAAAR